MTAATDKEVKMERCSACGQYFERTPEMSEWDGHDCANDRKEEVHADLYESVLDPYYVD